MVADSHNTDATNITTNHLLWFLHSPQCLAWLCLQVFPLSTYHLSHIELLVPVALQYIAYITINILYMTRDL